MSWLLRSEFFGGVALVLGLLTWLVSALLTVEMLFAMVLVHLPHGFGAVKITGMSDRGPVFGMPGYEVNLLYIAGLLALFLGGPGPLSVDARAGHGGHADARTLGPPARARVTAAAAVQVHGRSPAR